MEFKRIVGITLGIGMFAVGLAAGRWVIATPSAKSTPEIVLHPMVCENTNWEFRRCENDTSVCYSDRTGHAISCYGKHP